MGRKRKTHRQQRIVRDDRYPQKLKKEIDWLNECIYRTLDWLEKRLRRRKWRCGASFTEADVRLFTKLVRFDAVYYSHFKCNLRRLVETQIVPKGPLLDFSLR